MGYASDEQEKYLAGQMNPVGESIRNRELVPNLRAQRRELMGRVEKIDKLLGLLEKNPEFVKILDLTRELI